MDRQGRKAGLRREEAVRLLGQRAAVQKRTKRGGGSPTGVRRMPVGPGGLEQPDQQKRKAETAEKAPQADQEDPSFTEEYR